MELNLTFIDYLIFLIYIGLLFGFVYYKQKKIEEEDFLISKRNLSTIENLASINASKTGSVLIAYTALVYLYGASAIWYFIGICFGYLLFIPFGTKLYKLQKKKYYTLGDYFYKNYSKKLGIFITILGTILMFGFLCLNLIASAKVLALFTPLNYVLSLFLIMIIVFSYVVGSGFKSVIKTDFIQYLAIFFIIIFFGIYISNIHFEIIKNFQISLFNLELKNLIGFFLIGILFPFSQPELFQKVYASKNVKVFRKSMFYSVIIYFIVACFLTLISLFIANLYPNLSPDTAFVVGLYQILPTNINGFLVVVLFAALMSSLDTYLYTSCSSLVQDLFNFNKKKTKRYIRFTLFFVSLSAILIGILFPKIVDLSFIFMSFCTILGLTVISSWINFRINKNTLFLSSICGFCILILFLIFSILKNNLNPIIVIVGVLAYLLSLFLVVFFKIIFNKIILKFLK